MLIAFNKNNSNFKIAPETKEEAVVLKKFCDYKKKWVSFARSVSSDLSIAELKFEQIKGFEK